MTDIQRLTPHHLPQIIALHHAVIAGQPPGLIAAETDAFFADHMDRLGRIYGVFEGKRLIAYGVLGLPVPGSPNFGADHGLAPADLAGVAHIDGIAVATDCRGRGLHRRLIRHRIAEALAADRRILLSTAAPGNLPSLANLLACGLTVRGLVDKFDGQRYLMRRDAESWERPAPAGEWLAVTDAAAQHQAFGEGLIGWDLDDHGATPRLFLARPWAPTQPAAAPEMTEQLREARGEAIVERYAAYAAVGGLLPLALLDLIGIVAANLSMVRALSDLYEVPFERDRTRAVVVSVLAGLVPSGLGAATASLIGRSLPIAGVAGTAAASATALALTKAVGQAYLDHFETGAPLALPRRWAPGMTA